MNARRPASCGAENATKEASCWSSSGRRALVALAAVVAASLAVGAGSASAGRVDPPGHQDTNHCSWFSGVDVNELFGVPEQFHHFPSAGSSAPESTGARLCLGSRATVWTAFTRAGYVPLRPLPIEDFVAKLTVNVVTDGGTPKQKTYVFSPAAAVRTDITLDQLEPDAPPLGLAVTMPRMKPLSVGAHTYEVTWVLSAQHCDGLGAVVEENCLPAGSFRSTGAR